ncbi:DUF2207 domain-containing protein [Actinocrispum sp. NPDC049592]|uniref:DUF2207 domain-containing protein n=1 Tax=Actinocrispum sp. NPDC049592 TaxID=3154835 RepID=UPI00341566FD
MLTNWGVAASTLAAFVGLAVQPPSIPVIPVPSGGPAQPPSSSEQSEPDIGAPNFPSRTQVQLKVERDGVLSVTETITVRRGGSLNRKSPLRIQSGDNRDRVFVIRNAKLVGNGSVEANEDEFSVRLGEGKSILTYQVDGTVADVGDLQEVRWQIAAGWDARMGLLRASFIAPEPAASVSCLSGPFGSDQPCAHAQTEPSGVTRVDLQDLNAGDRVDLAVKIPSGTVAANAKFAAPKTVAGAFSLTPFSGFGLLALAVLLLAGGALLWSARRRDAKAATANVGQVDVLIRQNDGVAFASPDGVLPGQVGTVIDESVDAVDVTATVLDLAVRNYLWIEETQGDWRIVQRNPADAALTSYERAVYAAFATDAVSTLSPDMKAIKKAIRGDAVQRGWFKSRSVWLFTGLGVAVAGAGLTVALALTVGNALLGLAVVILGLALALGSRLLPARTKRGGVLVAQIQGLLRYLRETDPASIPDQDRDLVFSRSLPYAVALGEAPRWLQAFGPAGDLHWFSGGRNLQGFIAAMDAAAAK